MSSYLKFIEDNYTYAENINFMSFSKGKIYNQVTRVGSILQEPDCTETDCYMSMNPLVANKGHIKRDKDHVGCLRWLYVDLDYYNSVYKDFTKNQILGLLDLDYFGKVLPQPTYVIDSGRGMYLLWKINENVRAYSRWVTMQRYLSNCLEEFCADKKVVSDSARVFRKIGSINSKAGSKVKVMYHQSVKYSLTSLIREYVISDKPSEKMVRYAKHIAKALDIPVPNLQNREDTKKFIQQNKEPANLFYQQKRGQEAAKKAKDRILHKSPVHNLIYSRIKDLEKLLLKYRDKEGGGREHILFLYRYWQTCVTESIDEGLSRTLSLNAKLHHPLEESEVIKATASANKYYLAGKVFRCSNAYVIDALNITENEMQELTVFVSKNERRKRKQNRNKQAYQKKLSRLGVRTKKEQIKVRRHQIQKLLKKGLTTEEICCKLKISRATFYADMQSIERSLAAQKDKIMKLSNKYLEFKKKEDEKCLNFSAPLLNMSFRTWPVLQSSGRALLCYRYRQIFCSALQDFSLCCVAPWRWHLDINYLLAYS